MKCGGSPVEAHHLAPLGLGGTDADGGIPYCRPCHRAVQAAIRRKSK